MYVLGQCLRITKLIYINKISEIITKYFEKTEENNSMQKIIEFKRLHKKINKKRQGIFLINRSMIEIVTRY